MIPNDKSLPGNTQTVGHVTANGQSIPTALPCTLEQFLVAQKLFPRAVVVEQNGAAVAPSEFANQPLHAGDRLEIVRIVAGG
jgi:thiamine biosynthesis protein ThiS